VKKVSSRRVANNILVFMSDCLTAPRPTKKTVPDRTEIRVHILYRFAEFNGRIIPNQARSSMRN